MRAATAILVTVAGAECGFNILLELARTKLSLAGKRIEDLIDLPVMTDPYKLAAMRILSGVVSAAHFAAPEILPLIVFKQVSLSIKYGNTAVLPMPMRLTD